MATRIRRPETVTIAISGGDSIVVKKFLTAGEFRELIRCATRPIKLNAESAARNMEFEIDPSESGLATVLAYLLDWTFTDFDGRPIVIRGEPRDVVRAILDSLDAGSYMEIQSAIQAHDETMRLFLAAEKKMTFGSKQPDPILQSVG